MGRSDPINQLIPLFMTHRAAPMGLEIKFLIVFFFLFFPGLCQRLRNDFHSGHSLYNSDRTSELFWVFEKMPEQPEIWGEWSSDNDDELKAAG
jgi:hypothetical protein